MTFQLREIQPEDNPRIAAIIRQVLTEYGANRPGFAWADPELDTLASLYQADDAIYYVAIADGQVVGGAGIAPFPCEYPHTCEVQKMYLLPEFRGQGIGKTLMTQLLQAARTKGYKSCYLETFNAMKEALALYKKFGFQRLAKPLGDSGHNSCNLFYLLPLISQADTLGQA